MSEKCLGTDKSSFLKYSSECLLIANNTLERNSGNPVVEHSEQCWTWLNIELTQKASVSIVLCFIQSLGKNQIGLHETLPAVLTLEHRLLHILYISSVHHEYLKQQRMSITPHSHTVKETGIAALSIMVLQWHHKVWGRIGPSGAGTIRAWFGPTF